MDLYFLKMIFPLFLPALLKQETNRLENFVKATPVATRFFHPVFTEDLSGIVI